MTEVLGHGTDPVSALMHLISADNQRWLKNQSPSKQKEIAERYFDSTGVEVADVRRPGGPADLAAEGRPAHRTREKRIRVYRSQTVVLIALLKLSLWGRTRPGGL
ncbi:hypothetical protein [Streptomyces sp. NPDC056949]|uniref:hypothetical protein n=1 Tax=Streptomyces sp. NPDC056949 TaxID=3345976 RepID=UPI00363294C7